MKSLGTNCAAVCAALMVIMVHGAAAQGGRDTTKSKADTTHTQRLDSLIVTSATKTARTMRDVPVSTTVKGGDEIAATPAQSLDDVVRGIPGVDVSFENAVVAHPTANSISMRGLGGIRTLVLLDGVPINDPVASYVQWQKVPMELVDHIEVVRGGSSSLYGTTAMAGVINIITRDPTTNELATSLGYGTDNTIRGNILWSQSLGDATRLTVNANYFDTDGFVRPIPSEAGPIDIPAWGRAQNVYARLDFHLSNQSSAYLRTDYYDLYQNQGSPQGKDGEGVADLVGGWQRHLVGGGNLSATVSLSDDHLWTYNTDPITARGVDEFLSNYHTTPATAVNGSAQWSKLVANSQIVATAGTDLRSVTGEDQSDDYSAPSVFKYHEAAGGTQRTLGLYGQADYFPTSDLEVLASARLDAWQNVDGHDDKAPGVDSSFADKSATSLSPKLALRYHLSDVFTLRGAAYRAFNAPNLDELYRPYSAESFAAVPNSQLNPETLAGGEIGAEYTSKTASIQLNVFQSTITNVISSIATAFSPVYTVMATNLGAGRSRGVELFGNWDLPNDWRLSASYTYTRSIITSNPPDTTLVGNTQADTPNSEASATIGYFHPGRIGGFLRARYVGSRFTDATDGVQTPSFFVTDASASLPLGRRAEVFVQVENLLGTLYTVETDDGYDARGTPRQLFVGVRSTLTGKSR